MSLFFVVLFARKIARKSTPNTIFDVFSPLILEGKITPFQAGLRHKF